MPVKATEILKQTGEVPFHYVRGRETLYGSLQQLMYGSIDREDRYKDLTEGNQLRQKIEFISSIFTEWIAEGGLGCLADPKNWEWKGPQLTSDRKRHDWSSVGRFGGDVF